MKTHIKEVVYDFFLHRVDQMKLHTVHDGAANMMRTSELLNIKDPQHCLAHALLLLLTENGMKKIPGVQNLLQKMRNIVTALSYKSYTLSQEALFKSNIAIYEKLNRLSEAQKIITLDKQYLLNLKLSMSYKMKKGVQTHQEQESLIVTSH